LRQVDGFLGLSTNKTDRHDITEILLKVTLNTLNNFHHMSSKKTIYSYKTLLNLCRHSDNIHSRTSNTHLTNNHYHNLYVYKKYSSQLFN
jgi:hypothetical protein